MINGKKVLKKNPSIKIKIGHSESMSKSKKNTIDPQKIIDNYGADAVRLFILSDSPPEKDVQWSEEGIISAHKFIQKFWALNLIINEEIKKNHTEDEDGELTKFTNQFIKKVTNALNNFNYNVIIAYVHELYSFLFKIIKNKYKKQTLLINYHKILIVIMPVIPHLSNECIKLLNLKSDLKWPNFDEKFLIEDFSNIVVQVNGKKRGLLKTEKDIKEHKVLELINKDKNIFKYIEGNQIKKKIFIPNRLINIII